MLEALRDTDKWLQGTGPQEHVVVSSRARYARNLPQIPFPMRAKPDELAVVVGRVREVVSHNVNFRDGHYFDLMQMRQVDRSYLRENHLISMEMEKATENRGIFLSPEVHLGVMVNEEDHLRMFALGVGWQPYEVLNNVVMLDEQLNSELHFAFSQKYGFLTACPTNTGTGLRASVMLHLPALAIAKKLPEIIKSMPQFGLTVRGYYGENSENMGDFFQLSNEITLGKSESDIIDTLTRVVQQVIEKEEQSRRLLLEQNTIAIEDDLWRSYGILTNARTISSGEAFQFLSRLRFGIERDYFKGFTHGDLNRLVIEIQPSHLQYAHGVSPMTLEERDAARANLLRERLKPFVS